MLLHTNAVVTLTLFSRVISLMELYHHIMYLFSIVLNTVLPSYSVFVLMNSCLNSHLGLMYLNLQYYRDLSANVSIYSI